MLSLPRLTQGVEWVWLVWLVAAAVVLKMAARALRRWRRPRWGELLRGEEGVSYTLSYVMAVPLFFLFACLVFEATWLLVAKVGTLYAAHAGARSAVVWSSARSADPSRPMQRRVNQSAWSAMAPFVTGRPRWPSVPVESFGQAREYTAAYRPYGAASGDPQAQPPDAALARRYLTAASRTTVDSSPPDGGTITVTVTYRAPLHIPGVSRFLDRDGKPPYEYLITSSATLPNELPTSDDHTLGIDYQSP